MLLLREAIRKSGGDDMQFFQSAYYWKYKKQVDIWGDVIAFRTQRRIPDYVVQFMHDKYDKGG